MLIHEYVDQEINERKKWALRRQLGIPNDRQLLVIACMDERIPVCEALGICHQDAHIYRNAGGIVTDDVIRSAMLSTRFWGTKEIIIINHTECELMTKLGPTLVNELENSGINTSTVELNPALPELTLQNQEQTFEQWVGTFANIDDMCQKQVALLKESPLIPDDIIINGYIWQVESMSLRKPHEKVHDKVNTNEETDAE